MKRLLIVFLLLPATILHAQTLTLKKKQRFTYEMIQYNKYDPNRPPSSLNYDVFDFEVLKASKDNYVIKVTESIKISMLNGKLADSKLPLQAQQKSIYPVADKILSTSPYILTIDKKYNIINIDGLEELRAKISTALDELKVPDGREPNKIILDYLCGKKRFLNRMARIFPKGDALNLDSTYAGKGEMKLGTSKNKEEPVWVTHETLDSNTTLRSMGKEKKTGLLVNYRNTYESKRFLLDTKRTTYKFDTDAINLVSSNVNELGFGNILFKEFDKIVNYSEYYTPQQVAARRVGELYTKFQDGKGKLGLGEEIKREIDSLDRLFKDSDTPYWAARLEIAGFIGDRTYGDLFDKVPYDAVLRDFHLMLKLEEEYKAGNFKNFNYALHLLFKKFGSLDRGGYPLNMHILEGLVHDEMAKNVFEANNRAALLSSLRLIEQTETLKNPKVDRLFLALKTYTKAKLTNTAEEMIPLTNVSFEGLSNRKGRYRILIYDELTRNNVADSVRSAYLDYSIEQFKNALSALTGGEDRVITRKYLADAYYRKSVSEKNGKVSYLSLAGDYMPDQQDRRDNNYNLEPEYVFLPAKDYNQLLVNTSGSIELSAEQKLHKMVDLLIIEPERFKKFKDEYQTAYPKGDFKAFFNKALKSKLPTTPAFLLKETSGKAVGDQDFKQHYTFIDFWGTWCGACVSEIHLVEALHLNNPSPGKLKVTTIACFDKKDLVDDFMAKKKYSYQVLMSDGKVENNFKVSHYPTKILLLPNGVYLDIPSRSEYATLVNKYLEWEL